MSTDDHGRIFERVEPPAEPVRPTWVHPVALLAALIGLGIAGLTSVSLLSGMGQVEFGMVLAIAGAGVAIYAKAASAVKAACIVMAVLAVIVVVSDQKQLDQRRQDIQRVLNQP